MLHRLISPWFIHVVWIALLLALSPAVSAASPDFSKVNDILQGRRTLFPTDDIIVTYGGSNEPPTTSILQTTSDAISAQIPYVLAQSPLGSNSTVTASARMFNLPRDVLVTVLQGKTNLLDHAGGFNQSFTNSYSGIPDFLNANLHVATDLTGDGFADLVFIDSGAHSIETMTAADTNDLSQGFFYGTPMPLVPSGSLGLAAGDFNGDGVNEIAFAYATGNNIVVTIYRPNAVTNPEDNKVVSLSLEQIGSISIPIASNGLLALTAGTYGGQQIARIVLAYSNGSQTNVQPITVTPTSNPPQVTLTLAPLFTLAQDSTLSLFAQSGYLDFFDNLEQVVLELQSSSSKTFNVLTLDAELNVTLASSLTLPANEISRGFALGNFDQQNTGANPLNLEIVELFPTGCESDYLKPMIQIYHVDPANNFALSTGNSAQVGSNCYAGLDFLDLGLATGDTQGRSLVLGAPSKLVVQHVQPQLILGAPPMHLDYITPANGSQPEVLNLSAIPDGFFSSYQTKLTDQKQSSQQGTTSYTNAVKGSVSAGAKFGIPFAGSVTVKVAANAGFMHKKYIEKQYGQYTSAGFDASTSTGFDDEVWFRSETQNIYIYPVIGQAACPVENPSCNDSEKQPLTVAFSGPSQESPVIPAGGSSLEWYQPVHEVGNIFSYPWNLAQLEAVEGDIELLSSQDPDSFFTDSSAYTATATWSGQSSSSVTSGSASNISWGASLSVTEKAGIFGGFVGSQDFSYNGSKAVSTIYTQKTVLGESSGIGIVKPGTFPNPDLYQYPVFPYILGDKPPQGAVQDIDLGTDVQTHGTLRAAFAADPTFSNAGAWWQVTYTMPDVAVAHAARWSFRLMTPSGPQPNCINVNSTSRNQDCASFRTPQSDIWTSEFYWMKGLLITPADSNGQGPQIEQATAGEQILMQARVYNYSLVDMPTESMVVVRFYGQPWDQNSLQPAGNAFLIDEVELPPFPGFNSISSGGTIPNWTIAQTTKLDTTPYSGQYLGFWVMVYIKGSQQGDLVPELAGHGLTGIPPKTLNSISDATPYLDPYSNNVGFYKSLFYVERENPLATVDPSEAGLSLDQVEVSHSQVFAGQSVIISGMVHSTEEIDGLTILFYDGDPDEGGKVFDVDQISHIRANDSHLVKTVYHAAATGTHTLFLRALETTLTGQVALSVSPGFKDVPSNYWAFEPIQELYDAGIITGCGNANYCPEDPASRALMAVFLEKGNRGGDYSPPKAIGIFEDVSTDYWATDWIEQFYNDGLTKGCDINPLRFCPDQPVSRAEMAVFLLRLKYGSSYSPPVASGIFSDVPAGYWAADWIEQLYYEGITTGCNENPLKFSPAELVTRAEMAAFLVRTFGLE